MLGHPCKSSKACESDVPTLLILTSRTRGKGLIKWSSRHVKGRTEHARVCILVYERLNIQAQDVFVSASPTLGEQRAAIQLLELCLLRALSWRLGAGRAEGRNTGYVQRSGLRTTAQSASLMSRTVAVYSIEVCKKVERDLGQLRHATEDGSHCLLGESSGNRRPS